MLGLAPCVLIGLFAPLGAIFVSFKALNGSKKTFLLLYRVVISKYSNRLRLPGVRTYLNLQQPRRFTGHPQPCVVGERKRSAEWK